MDENRDGQAHLTEIPLRSERRKLSWTREPMHLHPHIAILRCLLALDLPYRYYHPDIWNLDGGCEYERLDEDGVADVEDGGRGGVAGPRTCLLAIGTSRCASCLSGNGSASERGVEVGLVGLEIGDFFVEEVVLAGRSRVERSGRQAVGAARA